MPDADPAQTTPPQSLETESSPPPKPEIIVENENNDAVELGPRPTWNPAYHQPQNKSSAFRWWISLVVLIAALSSTSIIWREEIVGIYPPANKLFMMIKMPVDTMGQGTE